MAHALSGGRDSYRALRERVIDFALRVIRLYSALPRQAVAQTIGRQLLRSATSVGAQFTEAHRAKSTPDFISKLEGAMQELEESMYWIELLIRSETIAPNRLAALIAEADVLMAILVSIVRDARRKKAQS